MSLSSQHQALVGAEIFTGNKMLKEHVLLLDGEKIVDVVTEGRIPEHYESVTLKGGVLAPGFIDLQVNGGGGVLFNDTLNVEGLETIAEAHRQYGTTSMLPTLISDKFEKMTRACQAVEEAISGNIPGILGIHLEGPYLNKDRKGVHNPDVIREVDEGVFDLLSIDKLGPSLLTLAPEKLPAGMLTKLAKTGFKICAGHTAATFEEIQTALSEGLSGFTHLFNAMTPMNSREPGVVGAALSGSDSYCGFIPDGFHIHPATMKVALAAKETGHMFIVSDAMPSVGAIDKSFKLCGEDIIVKNGKCVTQQGTLAGSDLDMIGAVFNVVDMLDVGLDEALRMASLYPANYLEISDYLGRLAKGYQADIVHFNANGQVLSTWIKGMVKQHIKET